MAGAANGLRQISQLLLGGSQGGHRTAGNGQAQQSHHAVGFDLKQTLHQTTQAALAKLAHTQQHTRATIGVDLKIGMQSRRAFSQLTSHQAVLTKLLVKLLAV